MEKIRRRTRHQHCPHRIRTMMTLDKNHRRQVTDHMKPTYANRHHSTFKWMPNTNGINMRTIAAQMPPAHWPTKPKAKAQSEMATLMEVQCCCPNLGVSACPPWPAAGVCKRVNLAMVSEVHDQSGQPGKAGRLTNPRELLRKQHTISPHEMFVSWAWREGSLVARLLGEC